MNAKADEKYDSMMQQNQHLIEQNSKMLEAITRATGAGGGTTNGGTPSRPVLPGGKQKHTCKNCKSLVYHKDEDCLELECNTHKRSAHWKLVLPS